MPLGIKAHNLMTWSTRSALLGGMVATIISLAGASAASAEFIFFSFDTGLQGWSSPDRNTLWASSGGNPGGYVRKDDFGARPVDDNYIYAPSSILGDWTSINGTGTIEYDHRIFSTGDVLFILPYSVVLSGPGGTASWTGRTPTGDTGWVHNSVVLDSSIWSVNSGSWLGLLSNVTPLQIQIELVANSTDVTDISGIDNIGVPKVIPEPSSMLSLAVGFSILAVVSIHRQRPAYLRAAG